MKNELFKRLKTEVVYFWEDEAQMFIKSIPPPNGRNMAKFPKGEEFEIAPDSDQVVRALAAAQEVTKKEYYKNIIPATDKAIAG